MYAIKGGWIGQTFALATCNESGGRKARIRRSKEERKTMVESFIKTYQISNDGKFPSLNLTHKEVGGSFYTVREIVREIIQENRVLGPAKFNSDNQKLNGNTREFPNESASIESHDYLFQLENENVALLDHHTSAIVEMNMDGNEQYAKHESVDAGEFVANTVLDESDKLVYIEQEAELENANLEIKLKSEDLDADQLVYGNTVEECDGLVSTVLEQEAELEVTGCSENTNLGIKLNPEYLEAEQLVYGNTVEECDGLVSTVLEQEAELEVTGCSENANLEIKLNPEDLEAEQLVYGSTVKEYDEVLSTESSVSESFVVEQEAELEVTGSSENANLKIKLNDNEEKHVNGSQVEELDKIRSMEAKTSNISPTEDIVVETFPLRSVTKEINTVDTASKLNGLNSGAVNVNDPQASSSNGRPAMVHEATSKDSIEDSASHVKSALLKTTDGSEELIGAKAKDDTVKGSANEIPKENQALKESKPTLDRINLGSWDGASKKSLMQERNPLFIFLKSMVSAFVKFLSE